MSARVHGHCGGRQAASLLDKSTTILIGYYCDAYLAAKLELYPSPTIPDDHHANAVSWALYYVIVALMRIQIQAEFVASPLRSRCFPASKACGLGD